MKKQFEDNDFDASLKKLNSNLMWRRKRKQELKNRIITDIEKLESDVKDKNLFLSAHNKKRSVIQKLAYSSIALIILLSLFISSAFISPTMAEVVSQIPYLNHIFKSQPLGTIVLNELKEKGYKISGVGTSYLPKKTIVITLAGSEEYYDEVKNEVKNTVNEVLQSKGYNTYSIKITKEREPDYVLNEEEKKEKSLLESEVTEKLKKMNYTFNKVQVDPTEKAIFINIEGSKAYYNDVKHDVEKVAKIVTEANHYSSYSIKVSRVTVTVEPADKGSQIFPVIAEGLMSKEEYKVTDVGYKSKPLTIMIYTSVQSSDSTVKNLGRKIETEINEFLKSEDVSSILGDETCEVIVYGKDKMKIN